MKCIICDQGQTRPGPAAITLQRGDRTLVFKGVPAEICENCGEYYLPEEIARGIHRRAEESLEPGADARGKQTGLADRSPRWYDFLNYSTLGLCALSLLAHVLGIGKLAYDVILLQQPASLGFKLIVLVVVLLFGIGLGVVSLRRFQNPYMFSFVRFYAWVYVIVTCLSYLGIAITLYRQDYTPAIYAAFVAVMMMELFAIYALYVGLDNRDIRYYSIPLLAICIVHMLLIVYAYVFASVPVSLFLAGDLLFFTGMTLMGSTMLGDVGFGSTLSKIADESYKSIPAGVRNWLEGETSVHLWKESPTEPKNAPGQGDKKMRDEKRA